MKDQETKINSARFQNAKAKAYDIIHKPREDVRSICLKCEANVCSLKPNDNQVSSTCYQGENVHIYRFFNKAEDNILDTHHMVCGACSTLGYTSSIAADASQDSSNNHIQEWI